MAQPRVLAFMGGAVLLGQERGNIEALCALQEQGCEVLCLVRADKWNTLIPAELDARNLAWKRVPYIEHRMDGRLRQFIFENPISFFRANWQFLKIIRGFRPTSLHAPNPLYVVNFLIGLAFLRAPMIFRAGDEPTVHNWLWRAIWRIVVWRTKIFVANSYFVARSLVKHGVQPEDIVVIYNAPPKRSRRVKPVPVTLDAPSFEILYLGQIGEHKGVHVLADAFMRLASEYPDATLVIAGRISDWSGDSWGQNLRERIRNDPLVGSRVTFVGDMEDISHLLASCSVHVAPSLFDDPSPNVISEAKEAGRPSIVFPRGGMPELVQDGVDGTICTEVSAEALAAALRLYLDDRGLAARHGDAARASLARLGIPRFAERWLEVHNAGS